MIHQDFFPKLSCVLRGLRANAVLELEVETISITLFKKKTKNTSFVGFTKSLKYLKKGIDTQMAKPQPWAGHEFLSSNHLYKQHLISLKTSVNTLIRFVDIESSALALLMMCLTG